MVHVTIVIPTYRRAEQTAICLATLAKNTGIGHEFDVETILVDDSPENEIEPVAAAAPDILNVRLIHLPNHTPVGAKRNLGAKETMRELMLFLDSDIEVTPSALMTIIDTFRREPRAAMISPRVEFPSQYPGPRIDRPRNEDRRLEEGGTVFLETNFGRILAVYRTAFLAVGGYDHALFPVRGEGVDLSVRFWRAGYPIVYADDALVYHHTNAPDSLTRSSHGETRMYESLALLARKYELTPKNAPYFFEVMGRGRDFDPDRSYRLLEQAMTGLTESQQSILTRSRTSLPETYPFTPQDVFTDTEQLAQCLGTAATRLASAYRKVFHAEA